MKRSTLSLLALALLLSLGALWLWRPQTQEALPSLSFEGYASAEALKAEAEVGLMEVPPLIAHPIDAIELTRPDGTLRFERIASTTPARWRMTQPVQGLAIDLFVEQLVLPFKAPWQHQDVRKLSPEAQAHYGLDPEHAVQLTLFQQGKPWQGIELWVGQVVQTREGSELVTEGTWVRKADSEVYAWLMPGRDLATPARRPLEEWRDRRLFHFSATEVQAFHFQREHAPFKAERLAQGWQLHTSSLEPGDDSLQNLANSLSELRVERFLPLSSLSAEQVQAFGQAESLEVVLKDQSRLRLLLLKRPDQSYWAKFPEGTEVYQLSAAHFAFWQTPLAELRDKHLFKAALTPVELKLTQFETHVHLKLEGAVWRALQPALTRPMAPESWLKQVLALSCARFILESEREQARLALQNPMQRIWLKDVQGQESELLIANSGPEGTRRFACFSATCDDAFVLTDFVAKRFMPLLDELSFKSPWPRGLALTQLTREGEGQPLHFDVSSSGLSLSDLSVNEVMPAHLKTELLTTLTELQARRFITPDKGSSAAALLGPSPWRLVANFGPKEQVVLDIARERFDSQPEVLAYAHSGPLKGQSFTLNAYAVSLLTRSREAMVLAP